MYIYPIADPEILKLGIRMALYREKKPAVTCATSYTEQKEYNIKLFSWQQSFIAYLKEPEVKVGETVYTEFDERVIFCIDDNGNITLNDKNGEFSEWIPKEEYNSISHYYPSQEYDGDIKHVERMRMQDYIGLLER